MSRSPERPTNDRRPPLGEGRERAVRSLPGQQTVIVVVERAPSKKTRDTVHTPTNDAPSMRDREEREGSSAGHTLGAPHPSLPPRPARMGRTVFPVISRPPLSSIPSPYFAHPAGAAGAGAGGGGGHGEGSSGSGSEGAGARGGGGGGRGGEGGRGLSAERERERGGGTTAAARNSSGPPAAWTNGGASGTTRRNRSSSVEGVGGGPGAGVGVGVASQWSTPAPAPSSTLPFSLPSLAELQTHQSALRTAYEASTARLRSIALAQDAIVPRGKNKNPPGWTGGSTTTASRTRHDSQRASSAIPAGIDDGSSSSGSSNKDPGAATQHLQQQQHFPASVTSSARFTRSGSARRASEDAAAAAAAGAPDSPTTDSQGAGSSSQAKLPLSSSSSIPTHNNNNSSSSNNHSTSGQPRGTKRSRFESGQSPGLFSSTRFSQTPLHDVARRARRAKTPTKIADREPMLYDSPPLDRHSRIISVAYFVNLSFLGRPSSSCRWEGRETSIFFSSHQRACQRTSFARFLTCRQSECDASIQIFLGHLLLCLIDTPQSFRRHQQRQARRFGATLHLIQPTSPRARHPWTGWAGPCPPRLHEEEAEAVGCAVACVVVPGLSTCPH